MNSQAPARPRPGKGPSWTGADLDPDTGLAELRLDRHHFARTIEVGRFFDAAEAAFAASGRARWYLLTNVTGFDPETDPAVWMTYSRRMHILHRAHGIARCLLDTASGDSRTPLATGSDLGATPLFSDRAAARDWLLRQPDTARPEALSPEARAAYTREVRGRLRLRSQIEVLDIDLRQVSFDSVARVDLFFDIVEETLRATRRKWFMLLRLEGLQIDDAVWPVYAARGKAFNLAHSLGSVRLLPGKRVAREIRERAESQSFDLNLVASEEEALERIGDMRAARDAG